jgi:large subunit ribosomal protein L6
MSRIGKQPIVLPAGVKAAMQGDQLTVEGPKGKLSLRVEDVVGVSVAEGMITCTVKEGTGSDGRARHGLTRSLIANMVGGVHEGYKKDLEINGVGYRANVVGTTLELSLGFSHPVHFPIPQGITITVEKQTRLSVLGADFRLVGQTAAEIRQLRKPEPYKGKGIKYAGEVIRRKAGKAAATAAQ